MRKIESRLPSKACWIVIQHEQVSSYNQHLYRLGRNSGATVVGVLLRGIVKKVDAELLERLRADPEAEFKLIVKTEGEPGQYLTHLQACGIKVRRKFRLTRSLAITARADAALQLADETWVEKIEKDQIVRTM